MKMTPYSSLKLFCGLLLITSLTACGGGSDGNGDSNPDDETPITIIDTDSDGYEDDVDNCINDWNPGQIDSDEDGIGDACDADDDDELEPAVWSDFTWDAAKWQ